MVLVDSSVWVLVATNPATLHRYAEQQDIATFATIVQELLQGADGPKEYQRIRDTLLSTRVLDSPVPLERYEQAARLYLQCRDAGYTIRKAADCLIAACALAHGAEVLHNDRDFQYIARVTGLRARRV